MSGIYSGEALPSSLDQSPLSGWKALCVFLEQILFTFIQMESSSCFPKRICNMNGSVITEEDYDLPCPSTVSEKVSKLSHLFLFVIKRMQTFPVTMAHDNRCSEQIKQLPTGVNKLREKHIFKARIFNARSLPKTVICCSTLFSHI